MRKGYVDCRYGQMHVRMAGDRAAPKRPLLCFHLSPMSGIVYESWIREMGRDRLALAPDTPGYGMSDASPAPPTIADYAAAMGDAADALGLREFDVMGYHTGSKIAVEVARQRPGQVRHLVLISTPVYLEEDRQFQQMVSEPPEIEADGQFLVDAWRLLLEYQDRRATPASTMRYFPDYIRGGDRRSWGYGAAFGYTYPEHIADVTAPVLVLNPEDDLCTYTARIKPYLRAGQVRNLPGWSHQMLDFSTAEIAAIVRPFLD